MMTVLGLQLGIRVTVVIAGPRPLRQQGRPRCASRGGPGEPAAKKCGNCGYTVGTLGSWFRASQPPKEK
jgi:hypothetical protein